MNRDHHHLENSDDLREYQGRFAYLQGAIAFIFLILFCRLAFLQVIKGAELQRFSEQNQVKEIKIAAPRGMIFDRQGTSLVDNVPTFSATLTPQYVAELNEAATKLAAILKLNRTEIAESVRLSRRQNGIFKPVHVKDNLTRDEVYKVERLKIEVPGLAVEMSGERHYQLGSNGAQFLGYTNEVSKEEMPSSHRRAGDVIGKSGVEKQWDAELRGQDGAQALVVDARGREVANAEKMQILGTYPEITEPAPGRNLTLTIDKDLQELAYNLMTKDHRTGTVIAMVPQTGEILALVNTPSFNPNDFGAGMSSKLWAELVNDRQRPMRNRAIQDYFPPGSTFKAIVAMAALEEKVITPTSTFNCPGFFMLGKTKRYCSAQHGHGLVNVVSALEQSCNVFFYHLALSLGVDKIAQYARKLGVGSKTEINLDGERAGLMPDSVWKKQTLGEEWQSGESLSVAIGQGFVALTPLQLITAYSAIGNGGQLMRPFIVSEIADADGAHKINFRPRPVRDITRKDPAVQGDVSVSQQTLEIVKRGLDQVFNGTRGTGRAFKIPGLDMAGKTGTAQVVQLSALNVYGKCETRDVSQRHNAWMVTFAPRENPQLAVLVHVEHGCHPTVAGPIVREIMLEYFKRHAPKPDSAVQ